MKQTILTLFLFLFVANTNILYSQITDKPLIQTEILSDRFRGENDGETAYFVFEGNVVLNATNMEIKCQKLEVFTLLKGNDDEATGKVAIGVFSSIEKILASGGVEITQNERHATSATAEVQPNEERIVLSGNPIIRQAGYEFSNPGGALIIDRGAGRISTPGEENARVRLIGPPIGDLGFEPDEEPEETPADGEANPDEEGGNPGAPIDDNPETDI